MPRHRSIAAIPPRPPRSHHLPAARRASRHRSPLPPPDPVRSSQPMPSPSTLSLPRHPAKACCWRPKTLTTITLVSLHRESLWSPTACRPQPHRKGKEGRTPVSGPLSAPLSGLWRRAGRVRGWQGHQVAAYFRDPAAAAVARCCRCRARRDISGGLPARGGRNCWRGGRRGSRGGRWDGEALCRDGMERVRLVVALPQWNEG
jgi:hypothetical protein